MMNRQRVRAGSVLVVLVLAVVGMGACGKQDADGKVPLGAQRAAPAPGAMARPGEVEPVITAESQALLEVGNAAFRRKDYDAALAAYEKAAKGSPEHAAPWMGIYMVARVRNDAKAMEAAEAQLRRLNPEPPPAAGAVKN